MPCKVRVLLGGIFCCLCAGIAVFQEYENTKRVATLQAEVEKLQQHMQEGGAEESLYIRSNVPSKSSSKNKSTASSSPVQAKASSASTSAPRTKKDPQARVKLPAPKESKKASSGALPPPSRKEDKPAKVDSTPAPTKEFQLDDFRMCRVNPKPVFGEPPIDLEGAVMPVEYQCDGEPYNQFATLLEQLVSRQAQLKPDRWGQRRRMVPFHKEGRSILILGNSHTRQLVTTLLCQYRDQIVGEPKLLFSMPNRANYGVWEINFENNLTVYSATNCPFIYNPQWYKTLETKILHKPLESLDAIVVGRFNQYSESTGTNFYNIMMDYQREFPEMGMDFENATVPTLKDIAEVYQGPIVYVGMFADYGSNYYQAAQRTVKRKKEERQNLGAIDGRHYISRLQKAIDRDSSKDWLPVSECSTDEVKKVTTCVTDTKSFRYLNGHRCMGARGGHPDLIAWDVVDFLHEMLPQEAAIE